MSGTVEKEQPIVETGESAFGIELQLDLKRIYSWMANPKRGGYEMNLSDNWHEIRDWHYDPIDYITISIKCDERKLDGIGRPEYITTYMIRADINDQVKGSTYGTNSEWQKGELEEYQKALRDLGIEATLVDRESGDQPVLHIGKDKNLKVFADKYEFSFFDVHRKLLLRSGADLGDYQEFEDRFQAFAQALGDLVRAKYLIAGKILPESKIEIKEAEKSSKEIPTRIDCTYCGVQYLSQYGSCPSCGGPRG